jgi:hypothetical protein
MLFRSKVIQEFHAFAAVKKFFIFGGQILKYDPKFFLRISKPQKALPSENLRRLRHYDSVDCCRSDCRGPEEFKKKLINTSGNCIFQAYGEQTPLNSLLSFSARHVTLLT